MLLTTCRVHTSDLNFTVNRQLRIWGLSISARTEEKGMNKNALWIIKLRQFLIRSQGNRLLRNGSTNIKQLQKLQNRAAGAVTNSSFDTPSIPFIEEFI